MADLSAITPDQELDLSEFGLQAFEDDLLIEDAGFEDTDNGRRWFVLMSPTTEIEAKEELPNGQVRDGGYITHNERDELVRIGVSSLKRLFKAALGKENAAMAELKGQMVHARVSEDDAGFARPRGYRAARG